MLKVQILVPCDRCNGQAYIPTGEVEDYQGRLYIQHIPCPACHSSGQTTKWISLQEFAALLLQAQCQHQHTSFSGGMHFSAGQVWDDIREVCDDCNANLD